MGLYLEKEIVENTDGVVLLVVRDSKSNAPIKSPSTPSVIDRLTYPIASVYNNLTKMQDINNDIRLELTNDWFDGNLDLVEIYYDSYQNTEDLKSQSEVGKLYYIRQCRIG